MMKPTTNDAGPLTLLAEKIQRDLAIVHSEQQRCWKNGDEESTGKLMERAWALKLDLDKTVAAFNRLAARA